MPTEKSDIQEIIRTKRLEIVDDNGKLRVLLTVLGSAPMLSLLDDNGKLRAKLTVYAEPLFALYDEDGNVVFSAPSPSKEPK